VGVGFEIILSAEYMAVAKQLRRQQTIKASTQTLPEVLRSQGYKRATMNEEYEMRD
jgi:hypothetical protein